MKKWLHIPSLRLAEIVPSYKKRKKSLKENYRPVNILPNLSKIYEQIKNAQTKSFLKLDFLSISVDFAKGSVQNNVLQQCPKNGKRYQRCEPFKNKMQVKPYHMFFSINLSDTFRSTGWREGAGKNFELFS